MADVTEDRAAVTRLVYQRLADPGFRSRLTAVDASGAHPIVVALRSDLVRDMLRDVVAVGNAANVAIPTLNGIIVLSVAQQSPSSAAAEGPHRVDAGCTVGVFVERLGFDGGENAYRFVVGGGAHHDELSAQAVAVAG